MRQIKNLAVRIAVFLMNLVYFFIKLFPVQKKFTFISRQSNEPGIDIVTLDAALQERYPDYQTVILCKKLEGKFAYIFHMFAQMYHIATSQVVLLDSYCIAVSVLHHKKSLRVIQMWHAIGSMKKFGYAMLGEEEGSSEDIARLMHMHRGYDKILISSKSFLKDFEEGFRMDPAIVEEIPLPKADVLTDPHYAHRKQQQILRRHPELENKKNILYCPTFRKTASSNQEEYVERLIDSIDYEKYNLIYKPHPLSEMKIEDPRVFTTTWKAFDMFFVSDYIISDYSSIIYEAGLLRKPVYLYAYDWEEYSTRRALNIDLAHDVPTLFTGDIQKIIASIEADDFDQEAFDRFIADNVRMPEGKSCCDAIMDLMDREMAEARKSQ